MDRRREVGEAVEAGEIFVCLPFILEAGYSARDVQDHDELLCELLSLPWAEIDETVERQACDAQAQLARSGHHRVAPVDVIMAALADHHELAVLHYDRDYDLIAQRTDLQFESVWLAERGSLA
jgi:predicted nucleic acid-binding protein